MTQEELNLLANYLYWWVLFNWPLAGERSRQYDLLEFQCFAERNLDHSVSSSDVRQAARHLASFGVIQLD